jgi:hypothetical protein
MNEPKVYKNSPATLILVAIFFILLIVGITVGIVIDPIVMILVGGFGMLTFVIVFLSVSSKVTISEDEITSQNILGSRTLRWTEITRASGTGSGIKLHSEDTTVSINPQLPGYEEIVEIIGQKRTDLFLTSEFNEMRRGLGSYLVFLIIVIMFIGIGVLYFYTANFSSDSLLPIAFIALFFFIFLWGFLASPQSLTIENNNLRVKYLLSEKNFQANEIAGVFFTFTRSRRGGKRYYVAITAKDGKQIRVSGLNISLPVAYLVLKNWHRKYTHS